MSGADLENLVNIAAIESISAGKDVIDMAAIEAGKNSILEVDLIFSALFSVLLGRERKSLAMTEADRKCTAYHESGHALVAMLVPDGPEIRTATILPRGSFLV